MSLLGDLQAYNIGFQNKAEHSLQGESASIVILKRESGTNQLTTLVTINAAVNEGWAYAARDIEGDRLPSEVAFELRISEELLTLADLKAASAIQHGTKIFKVIQPSPFEPTGDRRAWRFWITPAEEDE